MRGITNNYAVLANIAIASSVAPVTTGLTSPIAAAQRQNITAFIPIQVGATGGARIIVAVPAGGTAFVSGIKFCNSVADTTTLESQVASAEVGNALANAGVHWLEVNATIINGATAGNVDIQMAQNTSDVLTLTILRGGFMSATIF